MLRDKLFCFFVLFGYNSFWLLGVRSQAADTCQTQVYGRAGGAIVLSSGVSETLKTALWKCNGTKIADVRGGDTAPQFSGRVTLDRANYSLIVKELKITDSGDFNFVSENESGQRPTRCIRLLVQEALPRPPSVSLVNITASTNESCVILVQCSAAFDKDVSFRWTVNNDNFTGPRLQFTHAPPGGATTATCTVSNHVSQESSSKSFSCQSSDNKHKGLTMVLVIAGLSLVLIVCIVALVASCRRKRTNQQTECNDDLTLYAEIEDPPSNRILNHCPLYESVDHKQKPKAQTVYDEIQFSRMQQ
ncbi:unnamed protein product [Knipowitschia caucasica]|uniref:Ig-like domain-containing protein n=1 Tax=Knipowitschia caucasica TaxID=637954 RepID=A0AAV2KJR3_KNICA